MKIKEYYKHYLSLHQNKTCRRLHVLDQTMTLIYLACVIHLVLSISAFFIPLLLLVPFIVYPFAWSGHFFFEKNRPAAWSRPLWAKACDWVMLKDIIIGRIKW